MNGARRNPASDITRGTSARVRSPPGFNATFGNLPELIIAIAALRAGMARVAQKKTTPAGRVPVWSRPTAIGARIRSHRSEGLSKDALSGDAPATGCAAG
ncbi:hypothetical protein DC522_28625 [Microvirga sp. KLBC 81]|nr:hypothetical protein DC522_28625 [Microvirga sp. KLBC 81]